MCKFNEKTTQKRFYFILAKIEGGVKKKPPRDLNS